MINKKLVFAVVDDNMYSENNINMLIQAGIRNFQFSLLDLSHDSCLMVVNRIKVIREKYQKIYGIQIMLNFKLVSQFEENENTYYINIIDELLKYIRPDYVVFSALQSNTFLYDIINTSHCNFLVRIELDNDKIFSMCKYIDGYNGILIDCGDCIDTKNVEDKLHYLNEIVKNEYKYFISTRILETHNENNEPTEEETKIFEFIKSSNPDGLIIYVKTFLQICVLKKLLNNANESCEKLLCDNNKFIKLINECENLMNLVLSDNNFYGLQVAAQAMLKEISIINNTFNKKSANTQLKKIQVGGGKHYLKGFVNIDICEPADFLCDVRNGIPLKSEFYEFIFSEHFLEHLDYPISVELFISECWRLLKPGGEMVIGVPNARQSIEAYIKKDIKYYQEKKIRLIKKRNAKIDSMIDVVNYNFRDAFNHEKYTMHFWAYDEEKLIKMVKRMGFTEACTWNIDVNLVNKKRLDRTIYVKGVK